MKLILLGSGTSTGVPRIGNDWGDCDPADPRNRRTRVSAIVENCAGKRLLIDTSTDLRAQLLANSIDRVDAVFWTHDHADHTHGIDDLRPMRYGRGGPLPGYASTDTMRSLKRRFDYVFAGQHGYPTLVEGETLDRLRICSGFAVSWVEMPHGPSSTTGYRFDCDGKSIVYAVDFSAITAHMVERYSNCDILVSDCLRRNPHPTHAHLAMALELGQRCNAKQIVLTHMDKSMDHQALSLELPDHVMVGYDGLELFA